MDPSSISSPVTYLRGAGIPCPQGLDIEAYQRWWLEEGAGLSRDVDRAGTPWLRRFDVQGNPSDDIVMPAHYSALLFRSHDAGSVRLSLQTRSLSPFFLLGYITSFHDPGLYCPHTLSMATARAIDRHGDAICKARFLPRLMGQDGAHWQGATWFTERGGGSDLGHAVHTRALQVAGRWLLEGEKYFCSNVGAELALVAARMPGAHEGVKGIGLFLVPRSRGDGTLNYAVARIKDKIATRSVPTGEVELRASEAYLLCAEGKGIYALLDVLNMSRAANSIAAAALMQRALADVMAYARMRMVFGRPLAEQPLMARQISDWTRALSGVVALAWAAATAVDIWPAGEAVRSTQPADRLLVHLAKYWTAEQAVLAAKWAMEAHGGMGVLAEFGIERWLREAMILAIWEGPPQRQCLDAMEVMRHKQAHELLLHWLAEWMPEVDRSQLLGQIAQVLAQPQEQQDMEAERVVRALAQATALALARKREVTG